MSVSLSSEVTEDTQSRPKNQSAGWTIPIEWSGVSGGISDTSSGVMAWGRADSDTISANRTRWAARVGLDTQSCVSLVQTHSATIVKVGREDSGAGFLSPVTRILDADGLVTNERGVTLITSHADCAPVFLYHEGTRSIGLVHSGWRGTLAGIAACAVNRMQSDFAIQPHDLRVAIGPLIGTRNYEVGNDVALSFASKFGRNVIAQYNDRPHLDLCAAIVVDLLRAGVTQARHCLRPPDTYSDPMWSSYRRDGERSSGMLAHFRIV